MSKKGSKKKAHKKKRQAYSSNNNNKANNNLPKVEENAAAAAAAAAATVSLDEPTVASDFFKSDATVNSTSTSTSSIEQTTNKETVKQEREESQEKEQSLAAKDETTSTVSDSEALLESLKVGGNVMAVADAVTISSDSAIPESKDADNTAVPREQEELLTTDADHRAEEVPSINLDRTLSSTQVNTDKTDSATKEIEERINQPTELSITTAAIDDDVTCVKESDKVEELHDVERAPLSKTVEEAKVIIVDDQQTPQEEDPETDVSKLEITYESDLRESDTTAAPANADEKKDATVHAAPKVESEDVSSEAAKRTGEIAGVETLDIADSTVLSKISPIAITITEAAEVSKQAVEPMNENASTNKESEKKRETEKIDIVQEVVATTTTTTTTVITTPAEKPTIASNDEAGKEPLESKQEVEEAVDQHQDERRESVTEESVTVGSHSEPSVDTAINGATVITKSEKMSSTFIRKSRSVFLRKESDGDEKMVTKRKSQIISLFKRNEKVPPSSPLKTAEKTETMKMKKKSSWMFWKSSFVKP